MLTETIFALSSGGPPSAIAVIRISGPQASAALRALAGSLPQPRSARLVALRDLSGDLLDRALVLWLPGPGNATGEDCAELHCHGGRAVISAVEAALALLPGLRRAEPGEFTRRSFLHGKIDLAEAEGLADLLQSETDLQRRVALMAASGHTSSKLEVWRLALLDASARVEAAVDFADEGDVGEALVPDTSSLDILQNEIAIWLARPRAEALREGFRVVLAGPPNTGKSTLFNALVAADAAIVSPIAGTTRDVLSRPVSFAGIPMLFIDTAGLHDEATDAIEQIGIGRAHDAMTAADLILWLGSSEHCPQGAWDIEPQCDLVERSRKANPRHRVSAVNGDGLDALRADLVITARASLPKAGEAALNARQHALLTDAVAALCAAKQEQDILLVAECLRLARSAFDRLLGRTATEDMLDALFGNFCIGK